MEAYITFLGRKVRPKHVSGLKFNTQRIYAPTNDRSV
jgi:hypothetical protein